MPKNITKMLQHYYNDIKNKLQSQKALTIKTESKILYL